MGPAGMFRPRPTTPLGGYFNGQLYLAFRSTKDRSGLKRRLLSGLFEVFVSPNLSPSPSLGLGTVLLDISSRLIMENAT